MSQARLVRSNTERMIAGVCGGLATYLSIDPVLVRLAFVILLFATGIGLPIYLILWIVMPDERSNAEDSSAVIQKNIGELGETVYSSARRLGRPGTIGLILILFGAYFLLGELGLSSWLGASIFWPVVLIGLGIYLLVRRSK